MAEMGMAIMTNQAQVWQLAVAFRRVSGRMDNGFKVKLKVFKIIVPKKITLLIVAL
jgi:hypothetical protein